MNLKNKILAFALMSTLLSACTTVDYTSDKANPKIEHAEAGTHKQVLVTNYGYYLFNWIPLFSGGGEEDSFELFSDCVNQLDAMKTFKAKCEENGATEFGNLQIEETSTCFFGWVPYVSSTLGIYWYKEIEVSAVVSKGNTCAAKTDASPKETQKNEPAKN